MEKKIKFENFEDFIKDYKKVKNIDNINEIGLKNDIEVFLEKNKIGGAKTRKYDIDICGGLYEGEFSFVAKKEIRDGVLFYDVYYNHFTIHLKLYRKYTRKQIYMIRKMYYEFGMSYNSISKLFQTSHSHISNIALFRTHQNESDIKTFKPHMPQDFKIVPYISKNTLKEILDYCIENPKKVDLAKNTYRKEKGISLRIPLRISLFLHKKVTYDFCLENKYNVYFKDGNENNFESRNLTLAVKRERIKAWIEKTGGQPIHNELIEDLKNSYVIERKTRKEKIHNECLEKQTQYSEEYENLTVKEMLKLHRKKRGY